jgi:hypothetical protein
VVSLKVVLRSGTEQDSQAQQKKGNIDNSLGKKLLGVFQKLVKKLNKEDRDQGDGYQCPKKIKPKIVPNPVG